MYIYGYLIYNKGFSPIQWEKDGLSVSGVWLSRYAYWKKKKNLDP